MQDEEYNKKMYMLEVYNALYKAYADEIRNLWTRSVFLGAFMTLAWGGYGALQLKAIEKCMQTYCAYHYVSLGLCFVIMILSLLWIAMAKGSKFVQEAHETHIAKYNELDFLFCSLDDYQKCCYDTDKLQYVEHSTTKPLKSYRYSPSRINIFLGWLSVAVSIVLGIIHLKAFSWCIVIISIVVILLCFWQILNKN